jgi:hypothetical protein
MRRACDTFADMFDLAGAQRGDVVMFHDVRADALDIDFARPVDGDLHDRGIGKERGEWSKRPIKEIEGTVSGGSDFG